MTNGPEDSRVFHRYAASFTVSVADQTNPDSVIETAPVRDLSGGGISFVSRHADRYKIGQRLILDILLPHTEQLAARMHGMASVVRMQELPATEGVIIGLKLDEPLTFVAPENDK